MTAEDALQYEKLLKQAGEIATWIDHEIQNILGWKSTLS